jgi:hypothetical protein
MGKSEINPQLLESLNIYIRDHSSEWRDFIIGKSRIMRMQDCNIGRNLLQELWNHLLPNFKFLMQCNVKLQEIKVLRNLPIGNNLEGYFKWHSDRHPTELVNCILYLTDVINNENGPFQYLVESNCERPFYSNQKSAYLEEENIPKNIRVKSFLGCAGSYLIFDNNFFHRAGMPFKNYRDVIIFQIRPTKKEEKNIDWIYLEKKFHEQMFDWNKYE